MSNCEKWLFQFLTNNGLTLCDIVREKCKKAGFKKSELKSARKALGIQGWNDWAANGESTNWFWYLPDSEE